MKILKIEWSALTQPQFTDNVMAQPLGAVTMGERMLAHRYTDQIGRPMVKYLSSVQVIDKVKKLSAEGKHNLLWIECKTSEGKKEERFNIQDGKLEPTDLESALAEEIAARLNSLL